MSRRGFPVNLNGSESCHFTWSYSNGTVTPYFQGSSFLQRAADKVGGNTPGWPRVIQDNNYTSWSIDAEVTSCNISGSDSSPNTGIVSGQYPTTLASGISSPEAYFNDCSYVKSRAWDLCVSKLETRVKNQHVNVALVGAEFHKTCSTVASAATRIANVFTQVRSGKFASAVKTLTSGGGIGHGGHRPPGLSSPAQDFLALQYGWKPLLSDVYGACEELAQATTYRSPANKVTASATYRDNFHVSIPRGYPYPHAEVDVQFECTANGTIEYGIGSSMASVAASTGITNPLSVAWELVPYSFVVDWFLPVGAYLNNFDYDNGLIFNRGWISQKSKGKVTVTPGSESVSSGPVTLSFSGGKHVVSGSSYERSGLGGFPSVPTPHFKDPSSLLHASEAIALLTTAFAGGNSYR
jgi:hypothetical protein